ncbi:MAG TPA: hypothetical protein O0X23_01080 [Methanocorpusculum sp.]|nr:hypothetical protein [Methanocorpusculum sp.]
MVYLGNGNVFVRFIDISDEFTHLVRMAPSTTVTRCTDRKQEILEEKFSEMTKTASANPAPSSSERSICPARMPRYKNNEEILYFSAMWHRILEGE